MPKINWHEWKKEAFEKSKKEDKPILLDIHGVWCHWCHVMDKTSYDDEEVIELINKNFIPIKVDTDKRPDINKRYNQGGWPSTVFLTNTGQIITGTTYIPAEVMKDLIFKVLDIHKKINVVEPKPERKKLKIKEAEINERLIGKIMDEMLNKFDYDFGGFYSAPKFPMPGAISLALKQYKKTKSKDFLVIVRTTLDNMKGIFDDVEGGFYRYSVTQQWNEPHYEKMLETNAGVILNYLQGYEVTKKYEYKEIALKSLRYIKNSLSNNDGAFFGSQDADEEYCKSSKEERKKSRKPFVDRNIYTDLNSMMVKTYVKAYETLKDVFYKDFAIKTINFLLKNNFKKNFGMFHFFDGKNRFISGLLADNVYFVNALIDVYEITKDKKYLDSALKLNDFVMKKFMDKEDKCLLDKIPSHIDIGFLKILDKQINENAISALNLIKLGKITDNKEFIKNAENVLKAFSSEFGNYSIHGAVYGLALYELIEYNEGVNE